MQTPGPQPAKAVLAMRRVTNRRVAQLYGCSPDFAGKVLNGHVRAPARFRQFLSAYLEIPENELFRDETQLIGGGVS